MNWNTTDLPEKYSDYFGAQIPEISYSLSLNKEGVAPPSIDFLTGITFDYTGSAGVDWDKRKYIFHSNRGVVSLDLGTGRVPTVIRPIQHTMVSNALDPEKAVHPALRSIAGDIRVYPVPTYTARLSVESVVSPF